MVSNNPHNKVYRVSTSLSKTISISSWAPTIPRVSNTEKGARCWVLGRSKHHSNHNRARAIAVQVRRLLEREERDLRRPSQVLSNLKAAHRAAGTILEQPLLKPRNAV